MSNILLPTGYKGVGIIGTDAEGTEYSNVGIGVSNSGHANNIEFALFGSAGRPVAFTDVSDFFRGRTGLTDFTYDERIVDTENSFENCYNTFRGCTSLKNMPIVPDGITNNAAYMYCSCWPMVADAVCGDNVTNADYMYSDCYNLTGEPKCGANVESANYMYFNCNNLTGEPICGDKVINGNWMYGNCKNITGKASTGANLKNANSMYRNCWNLETAYIGEGVENAVSMFDSTPNRVGLCDLPSSLKQCNYLFWSSYDHGTASSKNSKDPMGGVYNWNCDQVTTLYNLFYDGSYRCPGVWYNGVHVKINAGTPLHSKLAAGHGIISNHTFVNYGKYEVLRDIWAWGNIFIHYNSEWNYHNDSATISTIKDVEILGDGDTRGHSNLTDAKIITKWAGQNSHFQEEGVDHPFLFEEQDHAMYTFDSAYNTYMSSVVINYTDGTSREIENCAYAYHIAQPRFSKGYNNANSFYSMGLPHVVLSEIDGVYPENIYFNGDWNGMFSGCTRMNNFPVFEVFDGPSYPHAFDRMNNFYYFFQGCTNIKENPGDWPGVGAFDYRVINSFGMFRDCRNLIGEPYFHENMGYNLFDLYRDGCVNMENFSDIPNFKQGDVALCSRGLFWTTLDYTATSANHNFGRGVYNCNYDNFSEVTDWFNLARKQSAGPTRWQNALHLKINKVYEGTDILTKTYNAFLKNTQGGLTSVDRPDNEYIQCGVSNFFIHYNKDWEYDDDNWGVDTLRIGRPNLAGTKDNFNATCKHYKAGENANVQVIESDVWWLEDGERTTWGKVPMTAYLKDTTKDPISFNSTYTTCYDDRCTWSHGWTTNSRLVLAVPHNVTSNLIGHEWAPEKIRWNFGPYEVGYFNASMQGMFNTSSIETLPVFEYGAGDEGEESFSEVENCTSAFYGCTKMASAPENMNFGRVVDCDWMFANCFNLKVDASNWNFSSATNGTYVGRYDEAGNTFKNCYNLLGIPEFPNTHSMRYMFANCRNAVFNFDKYNLSRELIFSGMEGTFEGCWNATGNCCFPEEVFSPGTTFGPVRTFNDCRNASGIKYPTEYNCVVGTMVCDNIAAYHNFNVYFTDKVILTDPSQTSSMVNRAFGWHSSAAVNAQKAQYALHLYDPYWNSDDASKYKTSNLWKHFSNDGQLTYTGRAFATESNAARTVTWTDVPEKGYLFNASYNIFYHYGIPTIAKIPLSDTVRDAFQAMTIKDFVLD